MRTSTVFRPLSTELAFASLDEGGVKLSGSPREYKRNRIRIRAFFSYQIATDSLEFILLLCSKHKCAYVKAEADLKTTIAKADAISMLRGAADWIERNVK